MRWLICIVVVERIPHGLFVPLRSDFLHLHAGAGSVDLAVYEYQLAELKVSLTSIRVVWGLTRLKGAPVGQHNPVQ